jgi:hypothetical protein
MHHVVFQFFSLLRVLRSNRLEIFPANSVRISHSVDRVVRVLQQNIFYGNKILVKVVRPVVKIYAYIYLPLHIYYLQE